jgi:hypothetical protein
LSGVLAVFAPVALIRAFVSGTLPEAEFVNVAIILLLLLWTWVFGQAAIQGSFPVWFRRFVRWIDSRGRSNDS